MNDVSPCINRRLAPDRVYLSRKSCLFSLPCCSLHLWTTRLKTRRSLQLDPLRAALAYREEHYISAQKDTRVNATTDEHTDLGDEGPVLHAVIEGVSSQTGCHRQNRKNARKQSRENQDFPQARVTGHAGHALSQRSEIL